MLAGWPGLCEPIYGSMSLAASFGAPHRLPTVRRTSMVGLGLGEFISPALFACLTNKNCDVGIGVKDR